jgi:Membrane protein implicated in regulation of membrane protease activity
MWELSAHYLWWILAVAADCRRSAAAGLFHAVDRPGRAAMGVVLWAVPTLGLLAQAVLFALLAFAFCVGYARWLRPRLERRAPGDERLNRRGEQMIGQRYVLVEPIVNGRGKARVGDGQWLVSGPDLPLGSTVEVVAVEGTTLQVRAAQ